jgi:hypothetical protein
VYPEYIVWYRLDCEEEQAALEERYAALCATKAKLEALTQV